MNKAIPPVDDFELFGLVVDHDIVRLDVPVHDALGVCEVESLEELTNVGLDVLEGKLGVEHFMVDVGDMLHNEADYICRGTLHNVVEFNDIFGLGQGLEQLDFSLYSGRICLFETLDHALLVIIYIQGFEYFRVFASPDFGDEFIDLRGKELQLQRLVVVMRLAVLNCCV